LDEVYNLKGVTTTTQLQMAMVVLDEVYNLRGVTTSNRCFKK